uniref:hypothetical protein n=1 Tax=Acaryochloris sp. IP29b_bin.137 TaxID=2969217 RepID=UPI002636D89C
AIKQISRRVKISGAQWNESNVPQVLAHRCAYLNLNWHAKVTCSLVESNEWVDRWQTPVLTALMGAALFAK